MFSWNSFALQSHRSTIQTFELLQLHEASALWKKVKWTDLQVTGSRTMILEKLGSCLNGKTYSGSMMIIPLLGLLITSRDVD